MLNYLPYFKALVGSKLRNEEGQGMVEYALIIALIAIVLVVALGWVSGGIEAAFDNIAKELGGAGSGE